MSAKRVREKPRGVLYYVGLGLSGGLLALVILVGMMAVVVPALVGATPLTVLTSSMEPKLPPGTLVIVKPADAAEIRVGDVITYQIESGKACVVTHRVTEISTSSSGSKTFTAKGDNNDVADAKPVEAVQIMGTVWYSVPWIGYVASAVNGDARTWLVPVIAAGLFLYAGYMVASGLASSAKKRRFAREQKRERELARADETFGRVSTSSTSDGRVSTRSTNEL
jgi:signal peptidase